MPSLPTKPGPSRIFYNPHVHIVKSLSWKHKGSCNSVANWALAPHFSIVRHLKPHVWCLNLVKYLNTYKLMPICHGELAPFQHLLVGSSPHISWLNPHVGCWKNHYMLMFTSEFVIVNPPMFDGQITIFVCGIPYFGWFKVQVSSQPCTNRLQLSLAAQPWLRRVVSKRKISLISKGFILFIHYTYIYIVGFLIEIQKLGFDSF